MDMLAHDAPERMPRKGVLRATIQTLGSLKLAVPLLALVALVIAAATVLEANRGREHAQWYVYHSRWFAVLLGLLAMNIFCAAASRWPWQRHHTGFVVTHCGLLILLAGAVRTFLGGVEGQVRLVEGHAVTKMTIPDQSQLTATWLERTGEAPYEFVFTPGPVDWREGKTLNLGQVDGVSARVLRYYRHARAKEDWIPDPSGAGGPSVRFKVEGPQGSETAEQVLIDQDLGDETMFGPIRLQLQRAVNAAMLADFLKPPTDKLGPKGMVVAYYKDQAKRIPIDENLGKRVTLDDAGVSFEIVKYLANARPDAAGSFRSMGESPANPMLELTVHLPSEKLPHRQVAFAKNPLLNLDPIYGQDCAVKFRYYHPAVKPTTCIELMQAADRQLYARTCADGKLTSHGKVAAGARLTLPGGYTFALVEHLPHVRSLLSFEPAVVDAREKEKPEGAVEVEITAGGATRTMWLQRNHAAFGTRAFSTQQGPMEVKFGDAQRALGFSLKLQNFRKETNPGGVGQAAFASTILLKDDSRGVEKESEISMNHPLTHNRLTFYQFSFDDSGHGSKSSTLSVGYDPGRPLKYLGSLLVCLGIGIMFYMRAYFFKKGPSSMPQADSWARSAGSPAATPNHDANALDQLSVGVPTERS